jgi:hypothetical protein
VNTLAATGGAVYLGGFFEHVAGSSRADAAAVDSRRGRVLPWAPHLHAVPPAAVAAITVASGTVYLAGGFDSAGSARRQGLAAVDAGTASPTGSNPQPSDTGVVVVHVAKEGVYVGGDFKRIGGARRRGLALLDRRSGEAKPWNPRADGPVASIAAAGPNVVVGGSFQRIGGKARSGVAVLDRATGLATGWKAPGLGGGSLALSVVVATPSQFAFGGNFEGTGGVPRGGLAAVDARTGTIDSWDPGPADGTVEALAVEGSTLYVGGNFRHIGGVGRSRLAAFDTRTGRLTGWNPDIGPAIADLPDSSFVDAIVVRGSTVYAGGYFVTVGRFDQIRNSLVAIDARTGAVEPWNTCTRLCATVAGLAGQLTGGIGQAFSLGLSGRTLYVGGNFSAVGPSKRANLAAVDADSGATLGWNPRLGLNEFDEVSALAATSSTVYVGATIGSKRSEIAALGAGRRFSLHWRLQLSPAPSPTS